VSPARFVNLQTVFNFNLTVDDRHIDRICYNSVTRTMIMIRDL
jgi:hypothetical protein